MRPSLWLSLLAEAEAAPAAAVLSLIDSYCCFVCLFVCLGTDNNACIMCTGEAMSKQD